MLTPLLTLSQVKTHLRIEDNDHDIDLSDKIVQTTSIIYDFLKVTTTPVAWINVDVSPAVTEIPALVQAAALLTVGELYMNRESSDADVLSDAVKNLLRRSRDPALA